MKQQSFILEIPKPCSENWNKMTPDAQGRFCDHCQKTVIDFTTWKDADLISFFKNNQQHTCGRFFNTQLNRPLTLPTQRPTRLYKIAIALGLTLLLAQVPNVYARPKAPLVEQNMLLENKNNSDSTTSDSSIVIKGIVLDATGQSAVGAIVTIENIDKTICGAQTDIDGYFKINLTSDISIKKLKLQIQYAGHVTKRIKLSKKELKKIKVRLTSQAVLGGIALNMHFLDPPGKTIYTREDINHMAH